MTCLAWFLAAAGRTGCEEAELLIFGSYGTPESVYVSGRALEKKPSKDPKRKDSFWSNLRRTARDLESDEIPGLRLRASAGAVSAEATTNDEGFFEIKLNAASEGFSSEKPPMVEVALADRSGRVKAQPSHTLPAILPPDSVALVSDIDDTIVDSQVTRKAILVYRTFMKNAAQLQPIPGVSSLYRGVVQSTRPPGAVFYLSGSPANLFERIHYYLNLHQFPTGPVLLKDLEGLDSLLHSELYKSYHLKRLAEQLPRTRFILFGDSGEKDAEIYTAFRKEQPERVLCIFIRRVETTPKSAPILEGVSRTEDAFEAARRLVRLGYLGKTEAEAVGREIWGKKPIPPELLEDLEDAVQKRPQAP